PPRLQSRANRQPRGRVAATLLDPVSALYPVDPACLAAMPIRPRLEAQMKWVPPYNSAVPAEYSCAPTFQQTPGHTPVVQGSRDSSDSQPAHRLRLNTLGQPHGFPAKADAVHLHAG